MNTLYNLFHKFFIVLVLFVSVSSLSARENQTGVISAETLAGGKTIELNKLPWKFKPGDDAAWADPQFDDSEWETLQSTYLSPDNSPASGWNGIGWFRLRVQVDESMANVPLALLLGHWGASEVYVDGKLIQRLGKVGATPEEEEVFNPNHMPIGISFGSAGEHLIAVRHSVMELQSAASGASSLWTTLKRGWVNLAYAAPEGNFGLGFHAEVRRLADAIPAYEWFLKVEAGNRFGRAGLMLTIALLHLLLFFYFPKERANLFFGLFALMIAGNIFALYITGTSHYSIGGMGLTQVFLASGAFQSSGIFLLAFLYNAFSFRIPKYFWVLVAWTIFSLTLLFFAAPGASLVIQSVLITAFLVNAEAVRLAVKAMLKKEEGAWLVLTGLLIFFLVPLVNVFTIFLTVPEWVFFIIRQVGIVALVLFVSAFLALKFARTNKQLEAELEHVKELSEKEIEYQKERTRLILIEAENERRAKELEEARQLQLSLLPKKLPEIPNLEIAAYMKPATEVGGDYYDFHVSSDGTLTIAVGDATGHGLRAGSIVTTAKGLFNAFAVEESIPQIFSKTSMALKKMNLRGLFMSMTMLKVKDNRLILSSAGMPSTLIYRAETKQVEEVSIRAVPLGSVSNSFYRQQETRLSAGDVVFLMSDGFPEMFNEQDEMLGYEKAEIFLQESAHLSAQEIISRFVRIGERWAGTRPLADDVTFVVVKMI